MTNRDSRKAGPTNLAELSRKTGLVIRSVDSEVISRLFVEIEKYDSREQAETLAAPTYDLSSHNAMRALTVFAPPRGGRLEGEPIS